MINELEKLYAEQQNKVIHYSKLIRLPVIGRFFRKTFYKEKTKLHVIFVDLRYQTRQIYPERFINSGGS